MIESAIIRLVKIDFILVHFNDVETGAYPRREQLLLGIDVGCIVRYSFYFSSSGGDSFTSGNNFKVFTVFPRRASERTF